MAYTKKDSPSNVIITLARILLKNEFGLYNIQTIDQFWIINIFLDFSLVFNQYYLYCLYTVLHSHVKYHYWLNIGFTL